MRNPFFSRSFLVRQLCILLLATTLAPFTVKGPNGPPLLSYADLVALYETDVPAPDLQSRLTALLNKPFVNNSISTNSRASKASIRIAMWNIERGLEFDAVRAALTNDKRFFRRLTPGQRSTNFNLAAVLDQSAKLNGADVVVLNEVDWGLKRTNYRNVARELAIATKMNYAYAVEFVEVDPLTLGTETLEGETAADR
jgi:hypothetical protein